MKVAGKPKKKENEQGEIVYRCPDCDAYLPKELFNEWKEREVSTYCKKHHSERQAKRNPGYYKRNREKIYAQQIEYRIRTGRRKPINEDEKEKDI